MKKRVWNEKKDEKFFERVKKCVLYKTQIGNFTELNMATEKINNKFKYTVRTNYKHFTKQIKPSDRIWKHKDFLIDNFKAMFMSSLNFEHCLTLFKGQICFFPLPSCIEK